MSTTISKTDAITQCRDAFAANSIPWDRKLESLPIPLLLDTARYWERKAEEARHPSPAGPLPITELLSITAIRKRLSKLSGFPARQSSTGGLCARQAIKKAAIATGGSGAN